MRLTVRELRCIILDEYYKLISEINLCHSPNTGKFTKCSKGSVYSLTKKGAEDNNVSKDFIGRGIVSSKEEDEPPRLRTPFGLNTSPDKQGGRKKISGDNITPTYSVSKYPEKYKEELDKLRSIPDFKFGLDDLEQAMILVEKETDIKGQCKQCEPCRSVFYRSFLNALNNAQKAFKGDLYDKK
jgi:hypothetical protein